MNEMTTDPESGQCRSAGKASGVDERCGSVDSEPQ